MKNQKNINFFGFDDNFDSEEIPYILYPGENTHSKIGHRNVADVQKYLDISSKNHMPFSNLNFSENSKIEKNGN